MYGGSTCGKAEGSNCCIAECKCNFMERMSKGSGQAVAQGESSEEPGACGWAESGTPHDSDEGVRGTLTGGY